MTLLAFLWIVGQASCSTDSNCPSGESCQSGICHVPINQAVAACACANGEAPKCNNAGGVNGESNNNGEFGNCSCDPEGFSASLRLVFRWEPADHITYKMPDSAGSPNLAISASGLTDAEVRATIQDAFRNWTNIDCGGGTKPVLQVTEVTPGFEFSQTQNAIAYADDSGLPLDDGTDPVGAHDIENRVWVNTALAVAGQPWTSNPCLGAVDSHQNCTTSSAGILATTPISYSATATNVLGRIYRARTVLNASPPYLWRTSSDIGCSSSNANCYDMLVTFTHELGHFLGYQHSACAASVMYGVYDSQTASLKEQLIQADIDSVCGHGDCSTLGYPNINDASVPALTDRAGNAIDMSTATRARFATCAQDGDCAKAGSRLRCIGTTLPGGNTPVPTCPSPVGTQPCAPANYAGFCSLSCTDTTNSSDCPDGEACVSNGSMAYCAINRTVSPCVVTTSGSGGSASGGSDGTSTGVSTGVASGTADAGGGASPTGSGGAFTDFCQPCTQESDCSSGNCVDLGDGNLICSAPCSSDLDCPTGASCLPKGEGFCYPQNTACIQQAVANVRALNEACDTQTLCAPGLVCVQLNNAAVCLEYCDPLLGNTCSTDGYSCVLIDSTSGVGVCFKATGHEGEDCVVPDTSLCGLNNNLICAGTAQENYQDAKCWSLCGTGYPNCSQSGQTCIPFSTGAQVGVCSPLAQAACLGQVGDKCATTDGSDCATGKCEIKGGLQACSRSCLLATQSGCPESMDCLDAGSGNGKGFCWPHDNTVTTASCPKTQKTGCGCHAEGGTESAFLSLVVLGLVFRTRRKRS